MLLVNRRYRLRRFIELRFPQDMVDSQQALVDEVITELRNRGVSDEEIQSTG